MRISRQNKILELIETHEIETQDKLASMLREYGYEVTQATISRDIKELQLIKTLSPSGNYKYSTSSTDERPISGRMSNIYKETVKSAKSSGNIVVLKTLSGCAGAAGEALDSFGIPHVIGSVAGDNTIMFVVDDADNAPIVVEYLNDLINVNK
ncbi:MAG: arginine repressor [Bacillota bacterium]|nr:arginine repressor [Bacillota bacterium]